MDQVRRYSDRGRNGHGQRPQPQVAWSRASRRGDILKFGDQALDGRSIAVDCGELVIRERDGRAHSLQGAPCLQELGPGRRLRDIEVASSTRHAVRTLLEEVIRAEPVAKVVVLPGLPLSRSTRYHRVAIDQDLDGPEVAGEVAGVAVCAG